MRISRRVQALAGGVIAVVASTVAGVGVGSASAASPSPSSPPGTSARQPDGMPVLSFESSRDLSITRNPDPGMAVVIGTVGGRTRPQPSTAANRAVDEAR